MSAASLGIAAAFPLPWDIGREDAKKFRQLLIACVVAVTIGGVVIPLLPVPEVQREELEELPPQLARILLEKPKAKPIPPPPPKPEVKQETPKPVEPPKEKPKPKLKKPEPKPEPKVDQAREKAATSGLLQFKDAFADMREAVDTSKLQATGSISRGAGSAATIDRSLLTSKHSARSAGVNVAALSSETGGVALAGRETTRVEAPKQSSGQGGARKPKNQVADARSRSIEDIRRIFDANKGAIFAIYNRALRSDPSLQGKVVLELIIDPNGRVKDCKVVASELADDAVIAKIINRIKLFDFGTRDVRTTTISYPVHFLPS